MKKEYTTPSLQELNLEDVITFSGCNAWKDDADSCY